MRQSLQQLEILEEKIIMSADNSEVPRGPTADDNHTEEPQDPRWGNESGGDKNDETTMASQPLQLDQVSLDAIISGVSARIMAHPSGGGLSYLSFGCILRTNDRAVVRDHQRQPGNTLAGE